MSAAQEPWCRVSEPGWCDLMAWRRFVRYLLGAPLQVHQLRLETALPLSSCRSIGPARRW
eukprot:3520363-Alexandrium_andersonii.AAC.1